MPIVTLSDGTRLQVSDNPTPQELNDLEEAEKVAASRGSVAGVPAVDTVALPESSAEEEPMSENFGQKAMKAGKFAAGSLGRLAGTAFLGLGDVLSGDPLGIEIEAMVDGPLKQKMMAERERVRNFLPSLIGDEGPKTPGERIAETIIQGGAMGLPGGKRTAAIAAGAGGGGQSIAELVGPETALGQAATMAGSLAGGLAVAGGAELTPRPLKDSLRDTITPEMVDPLRQAGAAAREARASGISSNLLDHYPGPDTRLHDIQQALVLGGNANKISDNIRAQGPQVARLANDTVDALPGNIVTKQTVANTVGRASTGLQKDLQKEATSLFDQELAKIKARQVDDARQVADTTGQDLKVATREMADAAEGGGKLIEADLDARKAAAKDRERRDQLAAGREVSNPTGFNVDELGNYGTMLQARRLRTGQPEKQTYSAEELLDAGLSSQEVRELVAKRQPVTRGTGEMQGDYTPGEPGRVGQVGDKIIHRAQKDYLDAAEAHENALANLAGVDRLRPDLVAQARGKIDALIKDARGNQSLVDDLMAIRDGFADLRTTKELQNYIVSVRHNLPSVRLNSRPADISEGSVLGAAIAPLKDLRNEITPGYAAADAAYKAAKANIAKIHDETDIGKLTPRAGTYAEGEAAAGAVYNLLKEGESPRATDGRLKKTLTLIGQKDPEGLQNTVKSYLDEVLTEAFGKDATGKPNARPGAKLTSALGSASEPENAARLNGLRIALDAVADTSKMSVSERQAMHRGVDHLRDIANANARTARTPTSMTRQELDELMREPRALAALRLIGISPGKNFLFWLQQRMNRKTSQRLDDLLSNPSVSNVEALIELGKVPTISRRKSALLASLIGWAATDAPPEDNPTE